VPDSGMINKLVEMAGKLSEERKKDPEFSARMDEAVQGQSPRFLMISQIRRSSQDLQLFDMKMGDVFHGTRVSNRPLLSPSQSQTLFAGPASYNQGFPEKRGVILTFDLEESEEIIRESLENVTKHPDLDELPIIAFRVDYESGRARVIAHGKGRDYEAENWLLSRSERPDELDTATLVLICSDSRVHPPVTPRGLPMAIQTLGGYIPKYSGLDDETLQLNEFFEDWLSQESDPHILVVAHGNFEDEGPSCGAGTASLNPANISNKILHAVISELANAAEPFESVPAITPEDRVKSLSSAVHENLRSYPAINAIIDSKSSEFIKTLLMDTVSNILTPND
jgi:carbonic anhydrase